jgi:hypothetical protein
MKHLPNSAFAESSMSYYVVMVDYGRNGREAVVDPEMTRRGALDLVREVLGDGNGIVLRPPYHHERSAAGRDERTRQRSPRRYGDGGSMTVPRNIDDVLNDLADTTQDKTAEAAALIAKLYGAPDEAVQAILRLKCKKEEKV